MRAITTNAGARLALASRAPQRRFPPPPFLAAGWNPRLALLSRAPKSRLGWLRLARMRALGFDIHQRVNSPGIGEHISYPTFDIGSRAAQLVSSEGHAMITFGNQVHHARSPCVLIKVTLVGLVDR